jgi:hypothetical protein
MLKVEDQTKTHFYSQLIIKTFASEQLFNLWVSFLLKIGFCEVLIVKIEESSLSRLFIGRIGKL